MANAHVLFFASNSHAIVIGIAAVLKRTDKLLDNQKL